MKYLKGFFNLPGTIFSGITSFIFGSNKKNKNGEYTTLRDENNFELQDNNGNPVYEKNFSLMGMFAAGSRFLGNFVANHKTAVSIAFWASLTVAAAAVLGLAFVPAALASVVAFQVAGYSIAGIVGAGFAAQLTAVAAVATAATSAVVYSAAAVVNTTKAFVGWVKSKMARSSASSEFEATTAPTPEVSPALSQMQKANPTTAAKPAPAAPFQPVATPAAKAPEVGSYAPTTMTM